MTGKPNGNAAGGKNNNNNNGNDGDGKNPDGNAGSGATPKVNQPTRNNKFPIHDPNQTIEHYLNRIEYWFLAEGIVATDEYQRFVTMMPQLPSQYFNELAAKSLHEQPEPYTKAKEALMSRFSMNEFDRVEKLLAKVEIGDKRPGDILQEMRLLNATSDESMLVNIWMRRIPRDIASLLIDFVHLPIDELRSRADRQYSMRYEQHVQSVSAAPTAVIATAPATPATPAGIPELVQMMQQMMVLMQEQNTRTIAAVSALAAPNNNFVGRERSHSRQRSQPRARSQSRGLEDNGQCWYHNEFGTSAQRCRPGCVFGNQPHPDKTK